ncbi:MAG: hypothetical protein HOZ81_48215 [Streptomyces sp.]|nr:hypothetical protein [Streptomyces sp.]NUP38187.1 hypothetical protein [Streptomyces sp.]
MAVLGFSQAGITLALVFGLSLSGEQTAAIMAIVATGLSLFVGGFNRCSQHLVVGGVGS